MRKRIISLLLVMAMLLSILCACGAKEVPEAAEDTTPPAQKVEEVIEEAPALFNETGYPIVNEPVTLTIMASVDATRTDDLNENTAVKYLEELTGVDIEIIAVPSTEFEERLSLTLAGDELPDIILKGLDATGIEKNLQVGNLIDLAPYNEAYGENIKAKMEIVEGMSQTMYTSSGAIGSLPQLNMMTQYGVCPNSVFTIYQPWLDALNLEVPTTAEELYTVLKAFKEQDPNGNGKADEVPFAAESVNDTYELFSMFGVIAQQKKYRYVDEGDVVKFSPFMPQFKDALTYVKKLYQEGLINQDVFTMDTAAVLAMGAGEEAIIGSTIGGAPFTTVGEERNADMALIPAIDAEGYDGVWLSRSTCVASCFMITKDCEYPEVAIRLIDYMYSDDGARLYWMGPEENYTWNDDGTWNWNLEDGQTVEQKRATATLQTSFNLAAAFPVEWFQQNDASEGVVNSYRVIMGTEYPENLRLMFPSVTMLEEDAAEYAIINQDLCSYVDNAIAQFIRGDMDIEKDWDQFVKQCETLRVDEYVAMNQRAYDAWLGK